MAPKLTQNDFKMAPKWDLGPVGYHRFLATAFPVGLPSILRSLLKPVSGIGFYAFTTLGWVGSGTVALDISSRLNGVSDCEERTPYCKPLTFLVRVGGAWRGYCGLLHCARTLDAP